MLPDRRTQFVAIFVIIVICLQRIMSLLVELWHCPKNRPSTQPASTSQRHHKLHLLVPSFSKGGFADRHLPINERSTSEAYFASGKSN
jgi:hypothetical protein